MRNLSPRTKIQKGLTEICSGNYYSQVPLDKIFELIKENGGLPVQEDGTAWSGFLCGHSSFTEIRVTRVAKVKWLHLAWYKMQSGRYEVTAYVN